MRSVGQYNVTHSALIALEAAEAALMPNGCKSRLWVGIECVSATLGHLAFRSEPSRMRLLAALEHVFAVQTIGRHLDQLPDDSPIARGLTLSIHLAHCALLDEPVSPAALVEAQQILVWAETQVAA